MWNLVLHLKNTKNHNVYSDKIILNVIDLTQIELATKEDKAYQIDYWARLFKATTWEELRMIAENNVYLENASQTMYELSGDELVQRQCRARRDYYKQVNTHNRTLRELEETTKELEAVHKEIDAAHKEIEQLRERIRELESQQK